MLGTISTLKSRIATVFLAACMISWHLIPSATSAQEISSGGAATFLSKHSETEKIGDVFGKMSWTASLGGGDRYLQIAMLGGLGEGGSGFLGFGGSHYWKMDQGFYPSLGVDLFYLDAGAFLDDTTIFFGPTASLEVLPESSPLKIEPFIAIYPAIMGDDATIFRFGITLNENDGVDEE